MAYNLLSPFLDISMSKWMDFDFLNLMHSNYRVLGSIVPPVHTHSVYFNLFICCSCPPKPVALYCPGPREPGQELHYCQTPGYNSKRALMACYGALSFLTICWPSVREDGGAEAVTDNFAWLRNMVEIASLETASVKQLSFVS